MNFRPLSLVLIAFFLGVNQITIPATNVLDSQKTRYRKVLTSINSKYQHVKECLQGKKPCTPADFAVFTIAILAAYGVVSTVRGYLLVPKVDYKEVQGGTTKKPKLRTKHELVPLSDIQATKKTWQKN